MRIAFFIGTALLLFAGAFAAFIFYTADRSSETDRPRVVVRVNADFDQSDASAILAACNSRSSSIVILGDGTAEFKPSPDTSIDTTACVARRLMDSGIPAFDGDAAPERGDSIMEAD